MTYSIKGLKTFVNRTPGFNVTLLRDDKPVAEVTNAGDGGCFRFDWKDPTIVTVHAKRHSGGIHEYRGPVEEAKLWEHVKTLPRIEFQGDTFDVDPDMFVEELVNEHQLEGQVKRLLKYPTIVGGGVVLQFKKAALDAGLRAYVAGTYPDTTFLNDMSFADAVAAIRKLQ